MQNVHVGERELLSLRLAPLRSSCLIIFLRRQGSGFVPATQNCLRTGLSIASHTAFSNNQLARNLYAFRGTGARSVNTTEQECDGQVSNLLFVWRNSR